MPLDPAELRRGRIVWAIYPFASQFPAEIVDDGKRTAVESVEEYARLRKGRPTELITEVRLRPVLLLHDGTRGEHDDVICLRINTLKAKHRKDTSAWRKIESHEHPFFFHLPKREHYGLAEESLIALTSIGAVHKSAIVDLKPKGGLNNHETQIISERLRTVLALDLSRQLAGQARELLKRAGVVGSEGPPAGDPPDS